MKNAVKFMAAAALLAALAIGAASCSQEKGGEIVAKHEYEDTLLGATVRPALDVYVFKGTDRNSGKKKENLAFGESHTFVLEEDGVYTLAAYENSTGTILVTIPLLTLTGGSSRKVSIKPMLSSSSSVAE